MIFAAVVAVALMVPAARADMFQLNVDYCGGGCISPPGSSGGTVTLTLGTGSNAIAIGDVEIDVSLFSPLVFHQTTGLDAFMFNYAGAGNLSTTSITTHFALSGPGTYHEDGPQNFNYIVQYDTSPGVDGSSLSFTLHSSSGALTLANLETTRSGASKVDFGANVSFASANGTCTGVIGGGNGSADTSPSFQGSQTNDSGVNCNGVVPEPTAIALYGSGLLVAGWWIRRRYSRT